MTPEQSKTITLLKDAVERDTRYDALILIGSLARGEEREDSDVDCLIIDANLTFADDGAGVNPSDFGGHFPAEVSITSLSKEFLEIASVRAPEPWRFAFHKAKVLYTRDPSIGKLVQNIGVYPDWERSEKMKAFYSQIPVHMAYLKLGEYSENIFLLSQTAHKIAFFCGRLILAYNRILYPNRKQFMKSLSSAPEKPETFIEMLEKLLKEPSIANAEALTNLVLDFTNWDVPEEGVWNRFSRDSEQYWKFNSKVAPEDW
ncbi:hypothetical protein WQ54_15340 [Bacillus sp. SA1-12]|uniref:nucleotidyltransferase domain-containing protein n=1 Tax=Bacillus sp. SA1-12 TaxID=1455638 RepID=UPI000627033D|nr:nucleotidyltransferase domain-containing protein [Bacillus sp. SA1-12]KKI91318.1 hypothetical protein WQ54_15340 [Bacillus sp. SA1-12]